MLTYTRWIAAGVAVVALGIGLLTTVDRGEAANADQLKAGLPKLAEAIKAKNNDEVAKLVASLSKETDMEDLMDLFKPRGPNSAGLGIGPTPKAITPDGVEVKIKDMADAKKMISTFKLKSEVDPLIEMAYLAAASAKITKALAPEKDAGKRKRADWLKWSDDTETAALALVAKLEAAKAEFAKKVAKVDVKSIQAAATTLDNACVNCHNVFKKN